MKLLTFSLLSMVFTVLVPIALVVFLVGRWRGSRGLSADEQRLATELRETAEQLRDRIATLERVLDVEVPGWRTER